MYFELDDFCYIMHLYVVVCILIYTSIILCICVYIVFMD
jgi:hypothetical protein